MHKTLDEQVLLIPQGMEQGKQADQTEPAAGHLDSRPGEQLDDAVSWLTRLAPYWNPPAAVAGHAQPAMQPQEAALGLLHCLDCKLLGCCCCRLRLYNLCWL